MRAAPAPRHHNARARRHLLLASASLISLLASTSAQAADILRSNVTAAPITASAASQAAAQQAALASQRAQETLTRTTQALQAMQAAQSAAHAMALSVASSIPNGLGVGGLQVVATPVVAAQDPTGLNTWQGADAPTQANDASGHANVTIKQNDSRAILSWQSYNVGKDTTLTYDQQGNKDWVALNRVVGADASPSQILGNIKADGTVLILNQNGIVFGGSSQINVNSLIATTLDIGRPTDGSPAVPRTVAQRNQEFLNDGLLGFADAASTVDQPLAFTFSVDAQRDVLGNLVYLPAGGVTVQNGANLSAGSNGYILLAAPAVENAGHLVATDGQVILAGADQLTLKRATGAADSTTPTIRGFVPVVQSPIHTPGTVVNDATGLIESPEGSILLTALTAAVNQGGLFSTTSVSRNGAIQISAPNIEIAPNSIAAILPSADGETIPQDPDSLSDFRSSTITMGNFGASDPSALIDVGTNALIYAPSGNIALGAAAGADNFTATAATARIFIDSGATIDASGLKDVQIPASRNQIKISPLKNNELADSPQYKDSFLNGATVYVDPRLSGVRDDGVAWIGSPLIDAASYYQQVGVSVSELMTKGGNVTLGVSSYTGTGPVNTVPNVTVKAGAVIDISGGWVTYQAGKVQTTQLVTSDGRVVDIGNANLDDTYVGIYGGFIANHARWGVSETYADPFGSNIHFSQSYTEGRDAGSLTIKGSTMEMDGTLYAQAFPGIRQTLDGKAGTAAGSVYGDTRALQGAPSQLPSSGFLFIQAVGTPSANTGGAGTSSSTAMGADIVVQASANYQPVASGLAYGQVIQVSDGSVTIPARDSASILSDAQLETITLSDALLSNSGLAQASLATSGAVTVADDASIVLAAGGDFNVLAGRKISIDGKVSVPSGSISLATIGMTSAFSSAPAALGDYDIVVNGTLSARGRWVNDFGLDTGAIGGSAWLNGGSITLYAAPRISTVASVPAGNDPATSTDLSGSILVNPGSTVDVSGGGRIDQLGKLDRSAKGGNLSLFDETSYFQIANWGNTSGQDGVLGGFRVNGLRYSTDSSSEPFVPVNPDHVNAHIAIAPDAIKAQGFAGGGDFNLAAPEFSFGDGGASTELPLDFVSSAGFANYSISSYKTDLVANAFTNGLGGTNAVLATQVLNIGAGQNLNLSQSLLPSVLNASQMAALRNLETGGDLLSILPVGIPDNVWDRKAVNLTLGGLVELDVSPGGSITGAPGASLTVSKLLNQGTIRLPGGNLIQRQAMPVLYAGTDTLAVHSLSDIFSTNPDGSIDENAASLVGGLTNAELAGANSPSGIPHPIYLLGNLGADQGIVLASGSVTDLSGISVRNPYALNGPAGSLIATGRILDGGTIAALPDDALNGQHLFQVSSFLPAYSVLTLGAFTTTALGVTKTALDVRQAGLQFIADSGATIDLSGAADVYDMPKTAEAGGAVSSGYAATPVWSNGGNLTAAGGATLTGASINAHGGAPLAAGGTLTILDPVLVQRDSQATAANLVSADMIAQSGFDTFAALGSLSAQGDVTLNLAQGFFLRDRPSMNDGVTLSTTTPVDQYVPTVRSGGGILTVNAPYIGFESIYDVLSTPAIGTPGDGTVIFNATDIDVTGILLIDQSVAGASFNAAGDMRLTGVQPWLQTVYPGQSAPVFTLKGAIASSADLNFSAGQIYPTTGSSFAITSATPDGTITFGHAAGAIPDAPYSAGGNLTVQAANIVQGGVIRVPLGTLTLGGSDPYVQSRIQFAPATTNLVLADGGVTSVSANGLTIPYGTTTDQTEWYFAPASGDPLAAPPQKFLGLNGTNIAIKAGATVDITGGGDIYAYEFVPGTGGSRDVLDQLNPDAFTGNNGYQYPDGRQVYAIVPGLSNAKVSAFDPIYSTGYDLSSLAGIGKRVHLDGGQGLAAGWYTLLPAKYALLPGGMRVVEETAAANVAIGTSQRGPDGSLITAGYYGNALSGTADSQVRLFNVQSQDVFSTEAKDVQTTGNAYFAQLAQHNGNLAPRLPVDAGLLVINVGATFTVDAAAVTSPGKGGRGAQVDVGGGVIDILASLPDVAPADGTIRVTAASLSNLFADSLVIGGARTDNADGSTSLDVTADQILVQNDSTTPLSAGEIVLAAKSDIIVADGSAIVATGQLSDTRAGTYNIGSDLVSGSGALLRVANGAERLVSRANLISPATLTVGAATLAGASVAFDSSGSDHLDPNLVIKGADHVSVGAPRIGFGIDPAAYDGLAITGALESLLTQSGGQLTLRSQSSIDFAGGTYDFGDVRFDAAALSSLDGGDVTIHGDAISLGNAGTVGAICHDCAPGGGSLNLVANTVIFTGGNIATKASTITANVPVTVGVATTVLLPTGTKLTAAGSTFTLGPPAEIAVPIGAALNLASGTGIILPAGADGALSAGTTVTPERGAQLSLSAGSGYFFPNGFESCLFGSCTSVAPGTFTLVTATAAPLPPGASMVLSAPVGASLSQFFGNVEISAVNGIFAQGVNGSFDVGSAPLALHTPYLGDRATPLAPGVNATIPGLVLASTGAVSIDAAGAGSVVSGDGIPGTSIAINGQSVSVSGTKIHASAGNVIINAVEGITLSGAAAIEASGYSKTLGDSADPVSQNAPGGHVTFKSQNADITLGDAALSVGGGQGNAGTLTLSAAGGVVDFGTATLDGKAGDAGAGGNFALDSRGAIDLAALNSKVGADGFTGGFTIHTGTGDLILSSGQSLTAGTVSLTADGGTVDIAGNIDTSGINGGDVALYGRTGVTLEGTAHVNASAAGYGANDTRQAKGGDVTVGTDFISSTVGTDGAYAGVSGAIAVMDGAVIDVSAKRPGDRLIPYYANNIEYYNYVRGDTGGNVILRAPVMASPSGGTTVNVSVANAAGIVGASAIDLIGFKRWDLGAVAASGLFTGVTVNGNTTTLDLTAGLDTANSDGTQTAIAGVNFLGDKGDGSGQTLVDFIQGYDISGAYSNLGGLSGQSNFHAQPGVDLDYAGNITLASNWNLGAGIVNQDAALAGGAMVANAALGKNTVAFGHEADLLENYTELLYRTHGSIDGEPGVLSLRAGGTLDIKGSVTDGFFNFRDQTDETYLETLGSAVGSLALTVQGGCTLTGVNCAVLTEWNAYTSVTALPAKYVGISIIPGVTSAKPYSYLPYGAGASVSTPPYNAAANSAAAAGSFTADASGNVNGGGDPIGSAQLFPLLGTGSASRVAPSWSYNLVAGADLTEAQGLSAAADPTRVNPAAQNANVIVEGTSSYTYIRTVSNSGVPLSGILNVDGALAFGPATVPMAANGSVSFSDWLSSLIAQNTNVTPTAAAAVVLPQTGAFLNYFASLFSQFADAAHHNLTQISAAGVPSTQNSYKAFNFSTLRVYAMPVSILNAFITEYLVPNQATLAQFFPAFTPTPPTTTGTSVTAYAKSLVRSGTGSINIAAAGNVDLTNGDVNRLVAGQVVNSAQVGGTTVYTAGHPASAGAVTVKDPGTGADITVDLSAATGGASNLVNTTSYSYGLGTAKTSIPGVLIADPVYAEGGGDVSVSAGKDILGRRDIWTAASISGNPLPAWAGNVDEPWRIGSVGANTTAAIDPQLFTDGIGALGGGDISVNAGENASDLAVIATSSLITAGASGAAVSTKALATFGSGNVTLQAGSNILGGRIDVASGVGSIQAGGNITDAGAVNMPLTGRGTAPLIDNLLRIRLTDAVVSVAAQGDIDLQGVASLGPIQRNNTILGRTNGLNALGLYSAQAALDLVADGNVTVANGDDNLLTMASASTNNVQNTVYPGSFRATALTGNLDLVTSTTAAAAVLLAPSPVGELQLFAGGNIDPVTIAMLDADPGILPGPFSIFDSGSASTRAWIFPSVLPGTSDSQRALQHKQQATHAGDADPVRIDAGNDIGTAAGGLILSVPKQARVTAGRDITNMMFFGQNLQSSDVTRIVAGRDITATAKLTAPVIGTNGNVLIVGTPEAALQGNTFVIGGPGSFMLEAGRDMGPFLNSAQVIEIRGDTGSFTTANETYAGGVLSVGNEWNPWLPEKGADVSVLFGVANGANYDGFRDAYLDPANLAVMPDYLFAQTTQTATAGGVTGTATVPDRQKPIYGPLLVQWMQQNIPASLLAAYGTTQISYDQAYAAFKALPELNQRAFLNQVYFGELRETSDPASQSYLKYARGYEAVNTLFPASYGYTQNDLTGGSNGANTTVVTGNLDLRLAAIETARGGNITIMGPGGRVIAGSTVRTDAQAARRTYDGGRLFGGNDDKGNIVSPFPAAITAIPSGYEGVLTLRGGSISTFTDGDFLLNQSRVFTEQGGDIVMWSSNADLNAGQGPKTSANFPPVLLKVNQDLYSEVDQSGATTGAGIASLQTSADAPASPVYLIAPRGTVDLGDAGVRASGDLSIAALNVANADNAQVGGRTFGVPAAPTVDSGVLSAASNAAAAVAQSVMGPSAANTNTDLPSIITVEVLGYGGDDSNSEDARKRPGK